MVAWFSRRQLLAALLAALGSWLGRRHRPRPAPATPAPARSRWRLPPARGQLAGSTAAGRLTAHYYDGRGRQVASKPGGPRTDDTTTQRPITSTTMDTATHRPISYITYDHPGAVIDPQPDDGDAARRPDRRPGTAAT